MSNESRQIESQLSRNSQQVENKNALRVFRDVDSSSTVQQVVIPIIHEQKIRREKSLTL